jgi:hypothetical protein
MWEGGVPAEVVATGRARGSDGLTGGLKPWTLFWLGLASGASILAVVAAGTVYWSAATEFSCAVCAYAAPGTRALVLVALAASAVAAACGVAARGFVRRIGGSVARRLALVAIASLLLGVGALAASADQAAVAEDAPAPPPPTAACKGHMLCGMQWDLDLPTWADLGDGLFLVVAPIAVAGFVVAHRRLRGVTL